MRRTLPILATLFLVFLVAAPAEGGSTTSAACGVQSFAYAGLEASTKAHGVSATLDPTLSPNVTDGHVGGWIGLGGVDDGPGGAAEWLQTGFAAFPQDNSSQMYYEVTVAGSAPQYVELAPSVAAGESHHFAVLEMANKNSWWRVWVDGKPVSPPIHLPGSHNAWYPQAVAENWNGGTGACNTYAYRFSDVSLAQNDGGVWRPLKVGYTFQDAGYHVIPISQTPRTFLAASLAA
ncbi:MAG TPA: hypothetical protein VH063_12405 [Gaiellaceae bacterium]|jgi:hypothetical protein|nr:hypothetical protein [Gaiellaceae bacterium]